MSTERLPETGDLSVSNADLLTPRIAQTLELLLDGGSEKEIALQLGVSRHTVHVYMKALYRHFGVCSRAELMALVLKAILRSLASGGAFEREARPAALVRSLLQRRLEPRAQAPAGSVDGGIS